MSGCPDYFKGDSYYVRQRNLYMSLTAKKGGTQNKTYSNEQYEQRKKIYNNKLWV